MDAGSLGIGDRLDTLRRGRAVVTAIARDHRAGVTAWNLTVGTAHTYYVSAAGTALLVHNQDCFNPDEAAQLAAQHSGRALKLGFGSQQEFVDYLSSLMRNGSGAIRRSLDNSRTAWWDEGRNIIVIFNKAVPARSTAFRGSFTQFLGL